MIIKARFLRDGKPYGKEYTYLSDIDVSAGDAVMLTDTAQGIVTAVDVPEEEVAAFRDKLKKISGVVEKSSEFSVLRGKTLVKIENRCNEELHFWCDDGSHYKLYHEQDCCESVSIEDIVGELDSLIGNPLTMAEEISGETGESGWDSYTWTYYKLATIKGYVTVRWYGESNGYYSECVDFMKCTDQEGQ